MGDVSILMIGGSLRSGSVNGAVLRAALDLWSPDVEGTIFDGMGRLPHFNPDDDFEPIPTVRDLRARIKRASAVLFSTPEYAGALPGAFKNLLEWTVGGGEGKIFGKPVAWINSSSSITHAADAYASLRTVLRFVGANVVEAACADIPMPRQAIDGDGRIYNPGLRQDIARVVTALVVYVMSRI